MGRTAGKSQLLHLQAGEAVHCSLVQVPENYAAKKRTTFTRNIQDRAAALIRTILDVRNLTALPASTALLKLKIWSAATYWIELIQKTLAENQKIEVESTIAIFLKIVLDISKYAQTKFAHAAAGITIFVCGIRTTYSITSQKWAQTRGYSERGTSSVLSPCLRIVTCISDSQTEFGMVNRFIGCLPVVSTSCYNTF
jgi:hypothetical protein